MPLKTNHSLTLTGSPTRTMKKIAIVGPALPTGSAIDGSQPGLLSSRHPSQVLYLSLQAWIVVG